MIPPTPDDERRSPVTTMTPAAAADFLHAFWRDRVSHGKQQVWTECATGKKRGPEAAPITDAEMAQLRAAYALLAPDAARAAWHGYQRNGVTICERPPGAIAARFALGDGAGPFFIGYDNGGTWNGWRCPLLPAAEAARLCAELTAMWADTDSDPHTWTFDAERGVIVEEVADAVSGEIERTEHEPRSLPISPPIWSEEDGDHLCAIPLFECGFGLCWDLAPDAPAADAEVSS